MKSKLNDPTSLKGVFFIIAGTTERVCLITGSVEAIMAVMDFIMDKIREKPDLKPPIETDGKLMQDRDKQVKILVPNSTAGMIIGKAGNYIKQIKEASGSYVQISQKAKDASLQERCITVIGESKVYLMLERTNKGEKRMENTVLGGFTFAYIKETMSRVFADHVIEKLAMMGC